ncbi:MAG: glycosyltransferase family 2 protein, partial [Acidimicrobiales bacterium]
MNDPSTVLDVEVSVVNHDGGDLTRACLMTLPAACEGLRWHATVVDNASVDGSADRLAGQFPDVTLMRNRDRHGFGANQNQVIAPVVESGSARYVLVLNNDTQLAEGCVAALVRHADDNPALGAVGPLTFNTDGSRQPSSFRFPSLAKAVLADARPKHAALGCTETDRGHLWLGGACLLLRADALRTVGPFDTRFFLFFEDIDLAHRLWAAGWESAVCPEASIVHHNHQTVTRDELHLAMGRQVRRSYYLYVEKYHGPISAHGVAALGRLALLARAVKAGVAGRVFRDRATTAKAAHLLA